MNQIPVYIYQPTPSKALSDKGAIVEDTFYLVEDGTLCIGEEYKLSCKFEVSQMQDGKSWVIIYTDPTDDIPILEFQHLLEQIDSHKLSVYGNDVLIGAEINVKIRHIARISPNTHFHSPSKGLRFECTIERYEAIRDTPKNKWIYFPLINLTVNSHLAWKNVMQNARYNFKERTNQAKLDSVIQAVIDEEIEELQTADETRQYLYDVAENAGSEYISQNNSMVKPKNISIMVGNVEIGKLYHQIDFADRNYENQPLSLLAVNTENLPDTWEAEEITNWICALFSLGLGRDISWNYYYVSEKQESEPNSPYLWFQRVWVHKYINQGKFFAFTEQNTYFDPNWGISEDSQCVHLINNILSYVLSAQSKIGLYYYTLRNYINYASHEITDAKHRSALMCMLGEEIYKLWIQAGGTPWTPSKDYLKPDGSDTNSKLYKKLMWLFESHGWNTANYQLSDRIWSYVQSRNSLFHEHKLVTDLNDDPSGSKLVAEMQNIAGLIPIMIATILGYKGEYRHPLSGRTSEFMPQ